jgi:hypothetical protein
MSFAPSPWSRLPMWVARLICFLHGHRWACVGFSGCPKPGGDEHCNRRTFQCRRCAKHDDGRPGWPSHDSCQCHCGLDEDDA